MNGSRKEGNGPLGGERPRGLFYVVPAGPKQCVVGFPQICPQGLPKWFQQVLIRPVWIPTLSVPIKND